jgi:DsbE subfamily thiol:disulfide oxidoreductase
MEVAATAAGSVGRRSRVVWIAFVVVAAALGTAALGGAFSSGPDPRAEGGVAQVEVPMPPLDGEGVAGGPVSVQDLAGHVTVVNIWATWCDPCQREQPALRRLAERYAARGVSFVGIDYRDDRSKARRWIEDFDVPYPSLYDPDGRTAAQLGFPFLPDTYVADADGTIRFAVYGETDEAELSGLIDGLLEGSG